MMFTPLGLIVCFLACVTQEKKGEDLSRFESKSLPLTFLTEDYSVYNFFDAKDEWKPEQDGFVHEGCSSQIGFSVQKRDNYQAIIYPELCSEDTLTYYLATVDSRGYLISKVAVMSLIDDDQSINSYLNKDLSEIKVVYRTFVENDNPKARIKTLEDEEHYTVEEDGRIEKTKSNLHLVRYYQIDNGGAYIRLK